MNKVRFILKNGCDFIVYCDTATIRSQENIITGYNLTGITRNKPLYASLKEVVAVIDEGPIDEGGTA